MTDFPGPLSAQSIRNLAENHSMIVPFEPESKTAFGRSYGLSSGTYDFRLAQDVLLWPKGFKLASTMEYVNMPNDVRALVLDKSTNARLGISAFNTYIDCGFKGFVTLELVNHSWRFIRLRKGTPIVQMEFARLDMPTDRPYSGKYFDQGDGPISAMLAKVVTPNDIPKVWG